jgi:hypothetical protein
MSLRIRRGTEQERIGRTFDQGEIIWTTNGEKLYVGDGVTPGGKNIAAQLAGTNLAFNATTGTLGVTGLTTDLVTEGLNNKYFSAEAAQDAIGAAIAAGSQSGISVVYNDNGAGPASINFTVTGGGGGGLSDVVLDTSPSLGGNLDLNGKNLFGTGSINIEGNFQVTGAIAGSTLSVTNGLGIGLNLNSKNISGTGNVLINGNFTGNNIELTGTVKAINGLGYNLNLNSHDITGFGGINIVGSIGSTDIYASDITATGTVAANTVNGDTVSVGTISISGSQIRSTAAGNSIFFQNTALVVKTDVGIDADGGMDIVGTTNGSNISSTITLSSSRGTTGSPTIVQNGDVLNAIATRAYNGSGYVESSGIITLASGTFSAGALSIPSTIAFFAGDGIHALGDGAPAMTFNNAGILNVPVMKVGGFTTVTLPASPQAGMIVLDTTTNQFKGYNGSTWVVLG